MLGANPELHQDVRRDDARVSAFPATTTIDGSPRVTPPRSDVEGDVSCIAIARGWTMEHVMAVPPCITLALTDACRCVRRRGTVIEARTAKDLLGPAGQVWATSMPRLEHSDMMP